MPTPQHTERQHTELTIAEIPFYQAVDLFENDKITEALPLFITCAMGGNLYAYHYIQFLLPVKYPNALTKAQADFINPTIFADFNTLPSDLRPDSWLKTALIKKSNWLSDSPEKQKKTLIELTELARWNGYAYHYLQDLAQKHPLLLSRIDPVFKIGSIDDMNIADLYSILKDDHHKIENKMFLDERKLCHQYAAFGKKYHGDLEGILTKKSSSHPKRQDQWRKSAALMGCKEAQFEQSKKTINSISWLSLAAKQGHQLATINIYQYFKKRKSPQSDLWIEKISIPMIHAARKAQEIDQHTAAHFLLQIGFYFQHIPHENTIDSFNKILNYYHEAYALKIPEAALMIGQLYCAKGYQIHTDTAYQQAVEWYHTALNHGLTKPYEDLAYIYYHGSYGIKSDFVQSKDYFERALRQGPLTNPQYYLYFAHTIFHLSKKWDKAFTYCENALAKDPTNPLAALLWGQYNLKISRPNYEKTKERLLMAAVKYPSAYYYLANDALKNKNYIESFHYAIAGYEKNNQPEKSKYLEDILQKKTLGTHITHGHEPAERKQKIYRSR